MQRLPKLTEEDVGPGPLKTVHRIDADAHWLAQAAQQPAPMSRLRFFWLLLCWVFVGIVFIVPASLGAVAVLLDVLAFIAGGR